METKLTKYIISNVLAMLGTSLYILADTFFISVAQGADGITALNLVLPLYGLLYALGAMLGIGSATRYSLVKSLESEQADHYFFNSICFALCFSVPFVAAGILRLMRCYAFWGRITKLSLWALDIFAWCFVLRLALC